MTYAGVRMALADTMLEAIQSCINDNRDRLRNISTEIWMNPELAFKETKAHDILTAFLAEEGFSVERKCVLPTGFKAQYKPSAEDGASGDKKLPNICLLCEYDALPELGHAAGHNLCAVASIAAAVAVKRCLMDGSVKPAVLTVLGTPAENCGGGKIDFVAADMFQDVDCVLMLSPMNCDIVKPEHLAFIELRVEYTGKAAHSSAFAWEGRNALDAAVACYNNIALLRQQLKPTWTVNGIIEEGGVQPNVIPSSSKLRFWLRGPDHTDLVLLQQRCTACVVAAGKATHTEAKFTFQDRPYFPLLHNDELATIYQTNAETVGLDFSQDPGVLHTGSTDMGNVSQEVPSLNPAFAIGTDAPLNSVGFKEAAGTVEAHDKALRAASALALSIAEVINNPEKLEAVKKAFLRKGGGKSSQMRRLSSPTPAGDA